MLSVCVEPVTSAENPDLTEEIAFNKSVIMPSDMNDYTAVNEETGTSPHLKDEQIILVIMDLVFVVEICNSEEEESEIQATVKEHTPKLSDAYTAMRMLHIMDLAVHALLWRTSPSK